MVAGCRDIRVLGAGVGRRGAGREPSLPPPAGYPLPYVNRPTLEPKQDSEKNARCAGLRHSVPRWSPMGPKSPRHNHPAIELRLRCRPQEEGFAAANRLPYLKLPLPRPKHSLCTGLLRLSSRWSSRGPKSPRRDLPGTSSTLAAGYHQAQLAAAMYSSTRLSKPVQSVVTAASSCSAATIMHEKFIQGKYFGRIYGSMHRRCFSTAQPYQAFAPPTLESTDHMSPSQERPISTSPFKIVTNGEPFAVRVNDDKEICKNFLAAQNMEKIFDHYERALKVRGLVSPFSLKDKKCQGLHSAYRDIVKSVVYLTAYDFSINIACMPEKSRRAFLDYLCDERVIVTRDWETMNTSVTHTLYDLGLKRPRDGEFLYKGECDASFKKTGEGEGKASIAVILWCEDQVAWCEVLEDVPCETSTEAECLAMCLLLKRAIQLGILHLDVCTDCDIVDRVVRGEHVYTRKDNNAKLYDLLRALRGKFQELVCRWTPRERLTFVDGLMRLDLTFSRNGTMNVVSRRITHTNHTGSVLGVWGPILSGYPIFSVKERASSLRNIAKKNIQYPENCLQLHRLCYHVVGEDEDNKVNALWHIIRAMKPGKVSIRMKSEASLVKVQETFGFEEDDTMVADENSFTLCMALEDEVLQKELIPHIARKLPLSIIWDAELFEKQPVSSFTIVFASSHEMNIVEELEEFSPVSFVSFKNFSA